jgi:hypothetical protein
MVGLAHTLPKAKPSQILFPRSLTGSIAVPTLSPVSLRLFGNHATMQNQSSEHEPLEDSDSRLVRRFTDDLPGHTSLEKSMKTAQTQVDTDTRLQDQNRVIRLVEESRYGHIMHLPSSR